MPEIGSPAWVDALTRSIAGLDADGLRITVLHRIIDGPAWRVVAAAGRVTVEPAEPGDEAEADVTFTWHRDDVTAVAASATTPLAVFQAGRLRVGGDLRRLTDATELFARFPGVPA